MAKTMPKFHVQIVPKNFGLQIVLNDLNLEFYSHQSIVVNAGSGYGKSVILECLFGNYKPENCSITIDVNKTIWVNNCQRDQIIDGFGMLFQGADLFDRRLVWETMVFGLLTRDPGHKKASETGINKPSQVGLGPDVVDRYPRELLDTMKKHAGLVRTIATNPGIVFFDEPTTGLDPITGDITNNPVVKCLEKSGATALTTTHATMIGTLKIADHIAIFFQGIILWTGPTDEFDDSGNEFADQFLHRRPDCPTQMTLQN